VQPLVAQLGQQPILLEPGPQQREVVQNCQLPHVETAAALGGGGAAQIFEDLALARGGPSDQQQKREKAAVHGERFRE
jgi:hypothetical protein